MCSVDIKEVAWDKHLRWYHHQVLRFWINVCPLLRMGVCRWFVGDHVCEWSCNYLGVHFLGGIGRVVPILLTSLPFWTEEPSEEAEGPLKLTPVAEEDEKDTNERDPGEGKNSSSKDPGKMLHPFPFLPPHPRPKISPSFTPSPHLLKAFIHLKLTFPLLSIACAFCTWLISVASHWPIFNHNHLTE